MRSGSWTTALAAFFLSAVGAQQFVMYTPGSDDTAVERMDSILNPGSISQHVHQIFGAAGMSPNQTYQSLQSSNCQTVADSSNRGNADDKSVYWHPALYMEAANGTGYVRVPTGGHKIYYRKAGSSQDRLADPFEFPEGFRMIAGTNTQRAPSSGGQSQDITQWICHSSAGMNQGAAGGFPTGVTDCDVYDGFNGAIHFPHCWNGKDFDQADPNAHMSYPTGDVQGGVCPSSHPIRLPHIFIENTFNIHAVVDQVKPNTFVLANGDPTGFGWHFDFFNGWNKGSIPALLEQCPQGTWGNEDIGTCPNFNASSVPASECKLTPTFVENVDTPGRLLPGCNPVSTANPAPDNAPAPLGVLTDVCKVLSGVGGAVSSVLGGLLPTAVPTPAPALPSTLSTVVAAGTPTPSAAASAPLQNGSFGGGSPGSNQVSPPPPSSPSPSLPSTAAVAPSQPKSSGGSGGNINDSGIIIGPDGVIEEDLSPHPALSLSSTTSSSSSGSSSQIHCPASNDTLVTSSSGQRFRIECGVDHFAGDMEGGARQLSRAWDLQSCIEECSKTRGCVDVSVQGAGCYLKSSVGHGVWNGVWGARLVVAEGGKRRRGHARDFSI